MARFGPFTTTSGSKYWLRSRGSDPVKVAIGFDIDSDPRPDIWIRYYKYIAIPDVSRQDKIEVTRTILSLIAGTDIQPIAQVGPPTGGNNKINPYYARVNNIRIAKVDYNRTEFFGTIGGVTP